MKEEQYMRLKVEGFSDEEIVLDWVGNVFLTRRAVARVLGCSLTTLATTYKRKGLRPLDRYVGGKKVYVFEDVEKIYNRREVK